MLKILGVCRGMRTFLSETSLKASSHANAESMLSLSSIERIKVFSKCDFICVRIVVTFCEISGVYFFRHFSRTKFPEVAVAIPGLPPIITCGAAAGFVFCGGGGMSMVFAAFPATATGFGIGAITVFSSLPISGDEIVATKTGSLSFFANVGAAATGLLATGVSSAGFATLTGSITTGSEAAA
ncbi:hypothetical protein D3C87_1372260 [compost metagenome]